MASLPRGPGGAGRGRKTWSFPCSSLAWKLEEKVGVKSLVSNGMGSETFKFGPDAGCMTFHFHHFPIWGVILTLTAVMGGGER